MGHPETCHQCKKVIEEVEDDETEALEKDEIWLELDTRTYTHSYDPVPGEHCGGRFQFCGRCGLLEMLKGSYGDSM